MLLRSPCKKLKSYHTPLCQFSNGGNKKTKKKWKNSPKIVAYGAFDETVCTAPLGPISAHADGGPRSPSAHAGPFARPPISMSGNFLPHVSAESPSNISPNQKSYLKFRNPRTKA